MQLYRTLEEGEAKSMRCKEKEDDKEDRDDLNAIYL